MRLGARLATSRRRLAPAVCAIALCAASGGAGGACGGGGGPAPVASLPSSAAAGAAFATLRDDVSDGDLPPATLRAMIERFLAAYPRDGQVPLARSALALVAVEQGDLAAADGQIAATRDVPIGSAQDLRTVARARLLRPRRDAESGLGLLQPLVGKNVDPLVRELFEKELTIEAVATGRDYEAISYMDAWLRATPEDDRPKTVKAVTAIVSGLPVALLESELGAMRAGGASLGYSGGVEGILAARLVGAATATGDTRRAPPLP